MISSFILDKLADGAGRLSPRAAQRLAHALAWFCWSVLRLRRRTVIANLHIAAAGGLEFPLGIENTARRTFDHLAQTAVEFLRGRRHPWIDGVDLSGREHLDAALSVEKGVYLLCAHQGNWEALGAALSKLIRPAHVLVKPVGSPKVNEFVLGIRRINGFRDIERRRSGDGVRTILRALGGGEMIVFVLDQTRPGEPRLPFFGTPAKTNTGLASLWRRHPAPVIPCWIERLGFGRHRIHFLPPVEINATADAKADIIKATSDFNLVLEGIIRQKPEQYFWAHRRWK